MIHSFLIYVHIYIVYIVHIFPGVTQSFGSILINQPSVNLGRFHLEGEKKVYMTDHGPQRT